MERFKISFNEIKGRLDPFYYRNEFTELKIELEKSPYKLVPLKNLIIELYRYPTFYNIEFSKKGVPVLKITNINKNGTLKNLSTDKYDYINESISQNFPKTILKENDIIMAVRGATIGKTALVTREFEGANINANLIKISLNTKKIIPYYFWIYCNTKIGEKLFLQQVATTAKQTITVPQIMSLQIPLPPLSIQKQLVKIIQSTYLSKTQKEGKAHLLINSLDDYILEELGINLHETTEKKFFTLNSTKLRYKRFDPYYYQPQYEEVEKISQNGKYPVKALKEITDLSANDKIEIDIKGKYIYVEIGDILKTDAIINLKAEEFGEKLPKGAKKKLLKNDIIISTVRPYLKGIAKIKYDKENLIATGAFCILRVMPKTLNPDYLLGFVRSKLFTILICRNMAGTTYPTVSEKDVFNINIPLPPLEVQNKIAQEIVRKMQKAEWLKKCANKDLEEAKVKVENAILGKEEK